MDSKKDIRARVLKERNQLCEKEWEEKSQRICEKVAAHPSFLNAKEVYCYVDFKNEVGTRRIIEAAWQHGKRVAVPKILEGTMEFYYIEHFSELEEGYFGISEPKAIKKASRQEALVIMPGVAFDRCGNRIGYGKGFYDRYLKAHPNCRTLAIAFELQMVEHVPRDAFDICSEEIITEENQYVSEFTE